MAVNAKGFLSDPTPGDNTLSGAHAKDVEDYITATDSTPANLAISTTTVGHRIFTLVVIVTN